MNKFATHLHCRFKPLDSDTISIEICDIKTQEHFVLVYSFREGKVSKQKPTLVKEEEANND